MTWLTFLMVAVILAAVAALTGVKPAGTRPVAGTHLMSVARIVLVLAILLAAYFTFWARPGG